MCNMGKYFIARGCEDLECVTFWQIPCYLGKEIFVKSNKIKKVKNILGYIIILVISVLDYKHNIAFMNKELNSTCFYVRL